MRLRKYYAGIHPMRWLLILTLTEGDRVSFSVVKCVIIWIHSSVRPWIYNLRMKQIYRNWFAHPGLHLKISLLVFILKLNLFLQYMFNKMFKYTFECSKIIASNPPFWGDYLLLVFVWAWFKYISEIKNASNNACWYFDITWRMFSLI